MTLCCDFWLEFGIGIGDWDWDWGLEIGDRNWELGNGKGIWIGDLGLVVTFGFDFWL